MFEVTIQNPNDAPTPCNTSMRALLRRTFDSEAKRIRLANICLNISSEDESEPEYLCRLKLVMIAAAPIRVVASSSIPAVAVTRAIQRAQSVLNGRRILVRSPNPIRDHLAA